MGARGTCRFHTDCDRITCGLSIGRSIEYMIFVEAYRRLGNPLSEFRREHLFVRQVRHGTPKKFRLRGAINADYFGSVTCHRRGMMYICRLRTRRRGFNRIPDAPVVEDYGKAVLTVNADESAGLPRNLEI